jgi:haloalkane dehalogenase
LLPIIEAGRAGLCADFWIDPWLHHRDVARSPQGLLGMSYTNPADLTDAALRQYLGPLVATPERRALIDRYAASLLPNPLKGASSLLSQCTVPTRIVWGMSDTIFSNRNPDYLAGILPQIEGIRRIEKARLLFPEEYPDVIAQEAHLLWKL